MAVRQSSITDDTWGGGSWGTDGRIVFTPSYQEGLWEVSEAGGAPLGSRQPDTSKSELGALVAAGPP